MKPLQIALFVISAATFSDHAKAQGWNGDRTDASEISNSTRFATSDQILGEVGRATDAIGVIFAGNDSLAAAARLSLTLTLIGAIILGLGMFLPSRASNPSTDRSTFRVEQSKTEKPSDMKNRRRSTRPSFRPARVEGSFPLGG